MDTSVLLDVNEIPERLGLRVVWLMRISEGWSNALVLHLDQVVCGQGFVLGIAPIILSHCKNNSISLEERRRKDEGSEQTFQVELLSKRFNETIANGLDKERVVRVVVCVILLHQLVESKSSR